MEMILSGKLHLGQEAARLGLVHRAVPDEELERGVDDLLQPILRNPDPCLVPGQTGGKGGPGPARLEQGLMAEADLFSQCHDESFFPRPDAPATGVRRPDHQRRPR